MKIAHYHQGNLTDKSQLNKGRLFTIYLSSKDKRALNL
ncbi:predicted acyl transferase [Crocosphaera chwakensis CCY0110]|uniref:Predicted acyl transferase n=1 Tax=Crocosphaera chwakensis CCY0110 TaxID=391612 RepID=A3IQJ7_9CHRO|nr:predicted acyl transferase [Crocosphaera chwakensis CCY0110]